jgi:Zn-dependent peptidase ImmA (M78 family)
VVEMPLRTNGFYYCVKGRHFIAIDSKLSRIKKLLVMFHEFAHFMMHVPDDGVTANFHGIGRRTRKEAEADAFALCALIPKTWMESRSIEEMIEEGFAPELLDERQKVFETYGL